MKHKEVYYFKCETFHFYIRERNTAVIMTWKIKKRILGKQKTCFKTFFKYDKIKL